MFTEFILYSPVPSNFLEIFQIYFQPEQLSSLDYKPYLNNDCKIFFENSVITDLFSEGAQKDSEYFGVVSHKLREKVNSCRRGPRINITRFDKEIFEERLMVYKPDVMGFLQYSPHDPVRYFQQIHPKLPEFFARVMKEIAYDWKPTVLQNVFYGNHFVMRSDLYAIYVNEMLIPAMEVMKDIPELFEDSGYPERLPDDLRKKWGIKHYPYHAFLCERMFSYWVHAHKLEVKYY